MKRTGVVGAGLIFLMLTGCSSDGGDDTSEGGASSGAGSSSSPSESADATEVAEELKDASSTSTKVVTITEDNDPNDLIGRPNGYETAAVIYDSEATCDSLGSDCGVVVEVFADDASAQARAQYIQGILAEAPAMGSEWDYVKGTVVVRVSGQLKPSSATNYSDAFGGEAVTAPSGQ